MLDIAFQYDATQDKWVPCLSEIYIHQDIEKLPYFLVLGDPDSENFQGLGILCSKHHKIEDVAELQCSRVVSTDGCVFEGLMAREGFHTDGINHLSSLYWESSYRNYCTEGVLIPFRWRIFQRESNGPINIACDVAEIHHRKYLETGKFRHWHSFSISADIGKRKQHITRIMKHSIEPSTTWMEETGIRIPECVVEVAMEALRESTRLATGIKPSVLSQMKGTERLTAYIERPFDLNIVFLKHFLQGFIGNNFDEVFPYDCKDNYRKVCQLLAIHPPKSLRKAYTFNPYSIVWYMLFQQWGIKDVNLMQKFFYLDRCVADTPLELLYFDKDLGRIKQACHQFELSDEVDWQAMERLCTRMLSEKGEKKFLRWLYQISAGDPLERWQWDIVQSFYQYENELSEDLKRIIVRDGLTQYVHDQISWEVTTYSKGLKDVHISYEPHILAYECMVNGYEFRLVHDTHTLRHVGLMLQNCVATYREAVISHRSIIVVVRHKGRYVACIELKQETDIVQALGLKNRRLFGEVLLVCRYWAKRNKLNFATDHLDLCEAAQQDLGQSDIEEIIVEPILYQKTMEEMNSAELLALPETEICPAYYKHLGLRLLRESKHNMAAPPWMHFQDEQAYLTYVFPQGQRIYDAAFAGNTVAQRVLGMMYYRGSAFRRDTDKALEWLSKAAQNGNEQARWEMEKLKKYVGRELTEKDFEILWGIYRIRHLMQEEECTA